MAHRCEHLCFTSQLWLPYLAFCFDLMECFWSLCIWSKIVGSKSGNLQYVLQIMTDSCDILCRIGCIMRMFQLLLQIKDSSSDDCVVVSLWLPITDLMSNKEG